MKSICITGATTPDLQVVLDIFHRAGMEFPKPVKHGEPIDVMLWHEQLLELSREDGEIAQAILNPGRLWEQLASNIFVANIRSKLWGWADSRSAWLLDFWLNFEQRLNFILVCVTPEQMLARAMENGADEISVEAVMDTWREYHQELLRFHHRNPDRSMLVDARECAANPSKLVEYCAEKWKLPLVWEAEAGSSNTEHDSLACYLAQQLCQGWPQTAGLQQELAATITHLGKAESNPSAPPLSHQQIISDYRSLRNRSSELVQVQSARDELNALNARLEETVTNGAHQQRDIENKLKESLQENELLLLQLHQVQEELEATFLKNVSQQKHIDDLQSQVSSLSKACEEQSRLAIEHQTKIEQLTKNSPSIENTVKTQTIALDTAQATLKESQQENELLLLQLHQVQEELEHYFLQHQDIQRQLKAAEERWQRMLQRNPAYCDYESIEVLAAENNENTATTWRLRNLNAASRSLPELEFKTIVEHGVAGFIFTRQPGATTPLTRWTTNNASQNELTLIPIGTRSNAPQRAETLLDLATGDWEFLQTLTRLLANRLESLIKAPSSFQLQPLRNGLAKLGQLIATFPDTLRYDRVSLKREQVNPDYEHLWLRIENLAFGDKRWPEFEFRLSCAHVRPEHFGTHPKLEFPEESSQTPFNSWFIESHDDFGSKLELRFALPQSMDMAVWERISAHDHVFLSALIQRLPAILSALRGTDVKISRPWEDWINMACELPRIVASCIAPPPPVSPPEPSQPALSENVIPPSNERQEALTPSRIAKTAKKPLARAASKSKAAKSSRAPKASPAP